MKLKKIELSIGLLLILVVAVIFFGKKYQDAQMERILADTSTAKQAQTETETIESGNLFISKERDTVQIRSKYSESQDIEVTWSKKGANNLFDYQSTSFLENSDEQVSNKKLSNLFHLSSTDTLGPHRLLAINNVDGDYAGDTHFSGGNHAYDGGSTGSPTARTENLQVFVDGELVTNFSGYADNIKITWENYVQASNTKKASGEGREVIKESYTLEFDGTRYNVKNNIEFLEDVYWEAYYGLQFSYDEKWNGTITYFDDVEESYPTSDNSKSDSLYTNRIVLSNGSDAVELGLEVEKGIGNKNLVNTQPNGAFNIAKSNKAYFWLVDGVKMSQGDIVEFSGYYQFYYQ